MPELWAGTDAGKAEHHCTAIDTNGTVLLSRRVPNNESELLELLGDVLELADGSPVTWAVDLNAGGAALWIALLVGHGQKLLYIPGRTVHHASAAYRAAGRRTRRTPSSSPTPPGCDATCNLWRRQARSRWTCGS